MTDGVIKGTGNSRYLKSVANVMSLYPEYTDFLQALAEGTFPVDLYGINVDGWQVRGNDLNKANLLKDTTASQYGKGTTATVDDILAAIRPLITTAQNTASEKCRCDYGSYTRSGASAKKIYTSFTPYLVLILSLKSVSGKTYCDAALAIRNANKGVMLAGSTTNLGFNVSWSGTSVSLSGLNSTDGTDYLGNYYFVTGN